VNLADTSNNIVKNNKIIGGQVAIVLRDTTNKIFQNKIENTTNGIVVLNLSIQKQADSTDKDQEIGQDNSAFLNNMTVVNEMTAVKNPIVVNGTPLNSENDTQNSE
jgi:parallel beta-helix repeat protein